MKKTLLWLAILVSLPEAAFAGPCITQSWDKYLDLNQNGGGCSIGTNLISDFSFDGGNKLTADKVKATPFEIGFTFDLTDFLVTTVIAQQTVSATIVIDFKVTDTTGIYRYTGETLKLTDSVVNNGDARITDPTYPNPEDPQKIDLVVKNGIQIELMASNSFSLATVMVRDQLSISSGMNAGASAQIKQYSVEVARAVPEPGTFTLFGVGIMTMAFSAATRRTLKRGPSRARGTLIEQLGKSRMTILGKRTGRTSN